MRWYISQYLCVSMYLCLCNALWQSGQFFVSHSTEDMWALIIWDSISILHPDTMCCKC